MAILSEFYSIQPRFQSLNRDNTGNDVASHPLSIKLAINIRPECLRFANTMSLINVLWYHCLSLPQLAHMVDLHLFLGRPLKEAQKNSQAQDDGLIGSVPQQLVDDEENFLRTAHDQSHDLVSLM